MEHVLKVQMEAELKNQGMARGIAAAYVADLDPTLEELTEVKTAVSEAFSNAAIHGYPDGGGKVEMEFSMISRDTLRIRISDKGIGIGNIALAMEPMFTTDTSDERSGMGFTVMESFMDKIKVDSKVGEGTVVTMIKKLDTYDAYDACDECGEEDDSGSGYAQVKYQLERMGVEVYHMQQPYSNIHIDGLMNAISDDMVLIHAGQVPYDIIDMLKKKGYKILEAPSRTEVRDTFGINFVTLEPGHIVMPAGNPRTQELLEKNGVKVEAPDISEIMKGRGALHCITAYLKRG